MTVSSRKFNINGPGCWKCFVVLLLLLWYNVYNGLCGTHGCERAGRLVGHTTVKPLPINFSMSLAFVCQRRRSEKMIVI